MIATAVTLPLVVILALVLARVAGGGATASSSAQPTALPAITTPAPQVSDATTVADCVKVTEKLPVQLGPLNPRPVLAERTVAWGDPPIVLRCGVSRPAQLVPASSALVVDVRGDSGQTVEWLPVQDGDRTVFTTIDRPIYVEVSVPKAQTYNPLPALSAAISAALPAVCTSGTGVPESQLCTHRS